MAYISIEQVISSAKFTLRLTDTTDNDNFLQLQILYAYRTIGSLDSYIKCRCNLDIVDGEACLPPNFYRLLALRYIPASRTIATSNVPLFTGGVYVDRAYLYEAGCTTNVPACNNNYNGTFQIVGNKILLNGYMPISKILIAYLGMHVDDNGNPMIPEEMELALSDYAAYRYAMSFPESYTPMQMSGWDKEWKAQAAMVKGRAAVRDFQQDRFEIMAEVNCLISAKNYYPL